MLSTITIGNIKQEIACMPSAASQLRLFALLHYLWPLNKGPAAPKTPKAFIFPKGVGKMKNGCPDFRAPAGGCLRPFPRKYIGVIYNKPNLTFFPKGVGKIENGCPDFRAPAGGCLRPKIRRPLKILYSPLAFFSKLAFFHVLLNKKRKFYLIGFSTFT